MNFDPYAYTIVVKRAEVDGERVFVATVRELHRVATEEGRSFPDPEAITA